MIIVTPDLPTVEIKWENVSETFWELLKPYVYKIYQEEIAFTLELISKNIAFVSISEILIGYII